MKVFQINDILQIYPHRYPMLMVDSIELHDDGHCIGFKYVTISELWFMGHFPEYPVLPGIVIIETMSQVGGMCFYHDFLKTDAETPASRTIGFIAGYERVRFFKKVSPGVTIKFETVKIAKFGNIGKIKGSATIEDNVKVAEAEIIYSFEKVEKK